MARVSEGPSWEIGTYFLLTCVLIRRSPHLLFWHGYFVIAPPYAVECFSARIRIAGSKGQAHAWVAVPWTLHTVELTLVNYGMRHTLCADEYLVRYFITVFERGNKK